MNAAINIERVKIFNKYKGDIDSLGRGGKQFEKVLFENNEWSLISEFEENLELINKNLVSFSFEIKALMKVESSCEKDCFEMLTKGIKLEKYNSVKEIIRIIETVKSKVNTDTDMVWTGFESPESLLVELDRYITELSSGNLTVLHNVKVEFAPSSTFQELSMTDGWSDEYLKISERFDKYCVQLERLAK